MLYRVAAGTGLRASELASLMPASFNLAGGEPCVTVAAGYSKRGKRSGRDDVQALPGELAAALAAWMKGKPKGERVFTMPAVEHVAEMWREDLRCGRAGWIRETPNRAERRKRREATDFLAYRDSSERFADFHSLRHTFVSWLVGGGASVSVCQTLARHSTPTLTIGVYSHPTLADHRAALEGLPSMTPPVKREREALKMTGTDDVRGLPGKGDGDEERVRKIPGVFGLRLASHDTSEREEGSGSEARDNPLKQGISRDSSGEKGERPEWDSNPRKTDLQSVPLDRSGIRPSTHTLVEKAS